MKASKPSYPAPAFHNPRHMSHPTPSTKTSPTSTRHTPRANSIVSNPCHTLRRVNDNAHSSEDVFLAKMDIDSSPSRTAQYSQLDYPSPRTLKSMELRLHDVVKVSLSQTDSESSTTSAKALALTKTPEIRLARLATPTGTPTLNQTFFPSRDSVPSRMSSEPSGMLINPEQEHSKRNAPTTPVRNDNISSSYQHHTPELHQNNPYQSQQHGFSQQQYAARFSQVKGLQQTSLQHTSPPNASAQWSNATSHPIQQHGSHLPSYSTVTTPGVQQTHPSSPHSMLHHSPYPTHSSSNHLSHSLQTGHTGPPSYPAKQPSPQLNASPSRMARVSPGLPQQSYHYSPPKNTQQLTSPHQHLSPSRAHNMSSTHDITHIVQDGSRSSPQHPQQVSPGSHLVQGASSSLLPHAHQTPLGTHHVHEKSLQPVRQVPPSNNSSPTKNVSLPTGPSLLQQQQQMMAMQVSPQQNSFPQYPAIQQSLSPSQQQAIFQQRMLQQHHQQQQQQMLQAQAAQQHMRSMQQQNPLRNASQTSALSHPSFQSGQFSQHNMHGQHPSMQLSHINMLQKLGQETNRSPLGITESLRTAGLNAYTPQNVHQQLHLMNGPNVQGPTVQGGMYVSNPQLFPFNPHQTGR